MGPKISSKNSRKSRKSPSSKSGAIRGLTPVPSVFPPMLRGKVLYTDYPILTSLLSGVASYVFRANSIYDPNFSGVGTTGYNVTQLAQCYDRYRVLNCEFSVDFTVTTGTTGGEVFVVLSNNNSLGTGIAAYTANRFVWRKPIGAAAGNGIQSAKISFPIHKVYGVPALQVRNEDDFASVMGNNPSNGVYIHIGFYATGAAGSSTCTAQCRIVYDTVFSLPVTPTP